MIHVSNSYCFSLHLMVVSGQAEADAVAWKEFFYLIKQELFIKVTAEAGAFEGHKGIRPGYCPQGAQGIGPSKEPFL